MIYAPIDRQFRPIKFSGAWRPNQKFETPSSYAAPTTNDVKGLHTLTRNPPYVTNPMRINGQTCFPLITSSKCCRSVTINPNTISPFWILRRQSRQAAKHAGPAAILTLRSHEPDNSSINLINGSDFPQHSYHYCISYPRRQFQRIRLTFVNARPRPET